MSDLIRREDALMCARPEYLNPNQEKLASYNQGWNNAVEMYYRQIAELPTVEPKVGKWFDHSDEGYVQCPFCGSLTTCEDNIDELHYCFNCGAKMERRTDPNNCKECELTNECDHHICLKVARERSE